MITRRQQENKDFRETLNPFNWDKETWIGGILMIVALMMFYFFSFNILLMETITINIYTRNEIIEKVAKLQAEVNQLENAKRTPFGDFCYEGSKEGLRKWQELLNRYPDEEVLYLYKGKPVKVIDKETSI